MDELKEQLNTLRNLCDISLIVLASREIRLIPTILEVFYMEATKVLEQYCKQPEIQNGSTSPDSVTVGSDCMTWKT